MDNMELNMRFFELYEKLASEVAAVNKYTDVSLIESVFIEIAAMFRLTKAETCFYRNPGEELRGGGETMISFDTGKGGRPIHTVRFETRLMSISTMTAYMAEDDEPLSEEEHKKVDLTMRTVLAFISRNRLQLQAEEMAFHDDAGYRNLRSYFNYLEWRGQSGGFEEMTALNYNLRHFTLVNNEFGRATGDIVLRNHYKHVEEMIGSNGLLARLGGDNFVCVCERSVVKELIAYLSEANVPYDSEGNSIIITASVGVFDIPNGYDASDPNKIMEKTMHAFRVAQSGGRDNVVYYNEELITRKDRAMRVQQHFPEALRNNEFRVFYQPKVNVLTGELCGAEALCRWFRKGKIVPPMEFIPVLEQTSDICKLDLYMLDLVCADIRRWLDEGRRVVRISVNFSRKHMMNTQLLKNIIDIVDRHNVPHEYIEIELTETTTDVEFRDLKRIVGGLHEANIHTSVDDFGVGYSSLNLIQVIPWNVLKVDRRFLPLEDESEDTNRSIMFRHVVSMANDLGLECIVEGVESPSQLDILRRNNCDLAQGFLFDQPLPVDEFEKRLDMRYYPMEE